MAFSLLKVFIPSWKFFASAGPAIDLFHRTLSPSGEWSAWEKSIPPAPRTVGGLFLNAEDNSRLAQHTVIDEFLADLEREAKKSRSKSKVSTQAEAWTSYRLLENFVRHRLRDEKFAGAKFQFKIADPTDDFILSKEHEVRDP